MVRAVPVAATAVAASSADAPDKVSNEPSATQRSLNSRRLSNLVALFSTTLSLRVRARSEDRLAEVPLGWVTAKVGASDSLVKIWVKDKQPDLRARRYRDLFLQRSYDP